MTAPSGDGFSAQSQDWEWAVSSVHTSGRALSPTVCTPFGSFIAVVGTFTGMVIIDTVAVESHGGTDLCVAVLDTSGRAIGAVSIGGVGLDYSYCLTATDEFIYIAGSGENELFVNETTSGLNDATRFGFIVVLDSALNLIVASMFEGDYRISDLFADSDRVIAVGSAWSDAIVVDDSSIVTSSTPTLLWLGMTTSFDLNWVDKADVGTGGELSGTITSVTYSNSNVISAGYAESVVGFSDGTTMSSDRYVGFICHHNDEGTLVSSVQVGGSKGGNSATVTSLDAYGNVVYAGGEFTGELQFRDSVLGVKDGFFTDGFLLAIDSTGDLLWASIVSSPGHVSLNSLSHDSLGALTVFGNVRQSDSFTVGTFELSTEVRYIGYAATLGPWGDGVNAWLSLLNFDSVLSDGFVNGGGIPFVSGTYAGSISLRGTELHSDTTALFVARVKSTTTSIAWHEVGTKPSMSASYNDGFVVVTGISGAVTTINFYTVFGQLIGSPTVTQHGDYLVAEIPGIAANQVLFMTIGMQDGSYHHASVLTR